MLPKSMNHLGQMSCCIVRPQGLQQALELQLPLHNDHIAVGDHSAAHSQNPSSTWVPSADAVCALQAGSIISKGSARGGYTIPKVLICSQLPADASFPLPLTLTLMDSPGEPTIATSWQKAS